MSDPLLHDAKIAVVIPAYNEAALIATTLAGVPAFVDHIVVVDDGSSDATARVALRWGQPRMLVVRHTRNHGVGAALATGYRIAFGLGADAVVVMGGDNQMDPNDLRELLAPVLGGKCDYAKGNRLAHPDVRSAMPAPRLLGNHLLSVLTRLCVGLPIRDSQCGYTALSRRGYEAMPLDDLWPGYGYPNDMLAQASAARLRVRDVVVRPVYGKEVSGIGLRHALVVVPFILLRALLRRLWRGPSAEPQQARLARQ